MTEAGGSFEANRLEKRTLLKMVGPPFVGRKMETQEVKIGNVRYIFPSPEAVQAELLRWYGKGASEETIGIWTKFLDFNDRLITAMREGRAHLHAACSEAAREKSGSGPSGESRRTLQKAMNAFADAQKILAEQGREYSVTLEVPEK